MNRWFQRIRYHIVIGIGHLELYGVPVLPVIVVFKFKIWIARK